MKLRLSFFSIIFMSTVLLFFQTSIAADLVWISTKNEFQADILKATVPYALWREGNKFLVAVDESQMGILSKAGLSLEPMANNTTAEDFVLIFPDKQASTALDAEGMSKEWFPAGGGCFIAPVATVNSQALSESVTAKITPLNSYRLRVTWIPASVASFADGSVPSDTLANRVSQQSLYEFNTRLEQFQTRYIWSDSIDAVEDWLVEQFLAMGYTDVTKQPVWYQNAWHYNIMAVKPGYAEPDAVIVIGAHFDSIVYGQTPGPYLYAPGSDDDGSGTAAVLELARILFDVPLRKTIVFMPFTAEEVGLIGSKVAAETFAGNGTNVEVMFNLDMIGYNGNGIGNINLSSGINSAYRSLTSATALRVSSVHPVIAGPAAGSSDHASFNSQGFNIVFAIESEFNQAGWHTNIDLTSRMDFVYMTNVVKMIAATVGYIADAASPTDVTSIIDQGDGQSVGVTWSPCVPGYDYTLFFGSSPGVYSDTIPITAGQCSYTVSGLTEGQLYYFSVTGQTNGVYPPVYASEKTGSTMTIPRQPAGFSVEPSQNEIIMDWNENAEADISHYRIYRNENDSAFVLRKDFLATTSFHDSSVVGNTKYGYQIAAVDNDGYESALTSVQYGYSATFDQGVLLVDETTQQSILPVQAEQEAWFSRILDSVPYTLVRVDAGTEAIDRSEAGRYSSLLWIDDDTGAKMIVLSDDSLRWYLQFHDNIFVAGLRTLRNWSGYLTEPGELAHDEFHISLAEENPSADFAGARGNYGWPSVVVRPTSLWPQGALTVCPRLEVMNDAQVIYRWDSFINDPAWEGQPCGVMYKGPKGYRIFLGFPLWFLTEQSARAVIQHALALFGEKEGMTVLPGDADGSGTLNISDIVFLANYLFRSGSIGPDTNSSDANSDCRINILDATHIVKYLFRGGAEPLPGCVH
jgi:Peptidase family M28/Dockerin type I domain